VIPSMSDRDGKIWMDGQMVDWRDAKIHVLTHTLHYGCGAFEGVRAYKTADGSTAIFRQEEHTDRLFNSAKILRMKLPFTKEEVNEAIIKASNGALKGVLGTTARPNVSIDFNHDPHSSVFHLDQTKVMDDTFVQILSWYDNEWGFSNRMGDTAVHFGNLIG